MTTEKLTIQQKLIQIQSELKVPKNNFSEYGGYNFAQCRRYFESRQKANLEHGLLLTLTDVLSSSLGSTFIFDRLRHLAMGRIHLH
ncbi:MAG: ERF family protein [Enterococcus casseliflavus]